MKNQILIHLALLAVLCISQFAAAVHMTGHLHAPVVQSQHDHDHPHFFGQHAESHKAQGSDTDELALECKLYHTYLSLSGCVPAYNSTVAFNITGSLISPIYNKLITSRSIDSDSIRGPPQNT